MHESEKYPSTNGRCLHVHLLSLKMKVSLQQLDLAEYNKRITRIEVEKSNLDEEIRSLQHEKKNLLVQLQALQNRLASDESSGEIHKEDPVQLHSSRHVPQNYRRMFERQALSYHSHDEKQDDDTDLNHDHDQKIFDETIRELHTLSLDQQDLLDLIVRTVTKLSSHLSGYRKLVSDLLLSLRVGETTGLHHDLPSRVGVGTFDNLHLDPALEEHRARSSSENLVQPLQETFVQPATRSATSLSVFCQAKRSVARSR